MRRLSLPSSSLRLALAAALCFLRMPVLAGAELGIPQEISPAGAVASRARLAVDGLGHAYVAMVVDGKARVRILGIGLSLDALLSDIRIPEEGVSVAVGPRGQAYLVFDREDNELGAAGREIFLASNPGGRFEEPVNISANRIDDRAPVLALDRSGSPRAAWEQAAQGGASAGLLGALPRIVYLDARRAIPAITEAGNRPAIAVTLAGESYLSFERDGALRLLRAGAPIAESSRQIAPLASGLAGEIFLGFDARGRLGAAWIDGSDLFLATGEPSTTGPDLLLAAPVKIDNGLDPDTGGPEGGGLAGDLKDDGTLVLVYRKGGAIRAARGDLQGVLEPRELLAARPDHPWGGPSVRIDSRGDLHLTVLSGGRVLYANDSPPPGADFTPEPASGELPLQVAFEDLSTGRVQAWKWDFGDGATSTERSPTHVYRAVGSYEVSLTVLGPGGENRRVSTGAVVVLEPSNTIGLPPIPIAPGEKGVWVPVLGFHRRAIQGFQLAGKFDPLALQFEDLSLDHTATDLYQPEFFLPDFSNEDGFFTAGVVLDFNTPFDGREIPAGADQRLIHLVVDIAAGAPDGDLPLELTESAGPSGLGSVFVVEGHSVLPYILPGRLQVVSARSSEALFLRGDLDGNLEVNVTDSVILLQLLFLGGARITCPDALDTDDSGDLDVSDAIFLLGYLFLAGPPLPVPFPGRGLDPTPDALDPCEG